MESSLEPGGSDWFKKTRGVSYEDLWPKKPAGGTRPVFFKLPVFPPKKNRPRFSAL